jgi:hypothetical protein
MPARPLAVARRIPGENPFHVDPALDLPHPVPPGVPGWSETAYVHVWNPDEGVGAVVTDVGSALRHAAKSSRSSRTGAEKAASPSGPSGPRRQP